MKRQRFNEEIPIAESDLPAETPIDGQSEDSEALGDATSGEERVDSAGTPDGESGDSQSGEPAALQLGVESIVLLYDGEAEQANFPVRASDGTWVYVHATKGKTTDALTPAIAAVLLEGKKGFTVASTVTIAAE